QRLAERHRDRIRNAFRNLPQEPPSRTAENAAPDAIHVHRNDRGSAPLDDALQAALERQQSSCACELTLGEDAYDFTPVQVSAGVLESAQDHARSTRRRD